MYENYSNLAHEKGFARHGRDMGDGDQRRTARLATDVSRCRLVSVGLRPATVGTVGAAEAGDIRRGAIGTGSALFFSGVAAALLAAMNGRENQNNILFSFWLVASVY